MAHAVTCGVCGEPAKLEEGKYKHEEEDLDNDHPVKPVRKGCC